MKRYRLMIQTPGPDPRDRRVWTPTGSVQIADCAECALREYAAAAGTWLVLCEDDQTWSTHKVSHRTEYDVVDLDANTVIA